MKAYDPIARRILERRHALGLSLVELAKKAGLRAPSHIHHIEKGDKVPSEEVAARIAQALGDDVELYRAWVRARQRGDYIAAQEAVRTIERRLAAEEHGAPLVFEGKARGEASEVAAGQPPEARLSMSARLVHSFVSPRLMGMLEAPPPSALARIPLLREGADPGPGFAPEPPRDVLQVLRLDPATLPREELLFRPFAYRLDEEAARWVAPRIRAGDLVVMTRNAWPIQHEEIYAVRVRDHVVLRRVIWKDETLWLLPAEGEAGAEPLEKTGTPPAALVGRVAITIRYGRP